jgi:hypothetical protein
LIPTLLTWYYQLPSDGVVKGISEGQLWAFIVLVALLLAFQYRNSEKLDELIKNTPTKLELANTITALKKEMHDQLLPRELAEPRFQGIERRIRNIPYAARTPDPDSLV